MALEAQGSNPCIHPMTVGRKLPAVFLNQIFLWECSVGSSPSGKAQDFDSCIRWFESSWPSLADVAELADAPDLGSGPRRVQVRFLSSAVEL